jgi:hypothetical protein
MTAARYPCSLPAERRRYPKRKERHLGCRSPKLLPELFWPGGPPQRADQSVQDVVDLPGGHPRAGTSFL